MTIQVALRNKAKESATILPANPKYLALSNGFSESGRQLTGSSPKMLVKLVNSGLLPKDARIAMRKDLEKAIKRANAFLSGNYVDFGLNLDSRSDQYQFNPVYAKALAEDLKAVGIDLKDAKLIPYDILTDEFRLSEKGKDTAKKFILNTKDFKWNYEPSTSGLFGAGLDGDGDWDCRDVSLAGSDPGGRVVVITGEASSQNFLNEYTFKLRENKNKAISSVREKYQKEVVSLRIE